MVRFIHSVLPLVLLSACSGPDAAATPAPALSNEAALVEPGRAERPPTHAARPLRATSIAVSHDSSCARFDDGTVRCMDRFGERVVARDAVDVVRLARGNELCVVRAGGRHECGRNTDLLVLSPVEHTPVGAGCAITTEGELRCPSDLHPSVGPPTVAIRGPARVVTATIVGETGCALDDAREVWCWDTTRPRNSAERVVLASGATAVQLVSTTLYWLDDEGRLRRATRSGTRWPARGELVELRGSARSFSAADSRTVCVLLETGDVECTGALALDEDAARPLRGATSVVAGREHACALLPDGSVVCWGRNATGALGPSERSWVPPALAMSGASALSEVPGGVCATGEEGTSCFGWHLNASSLRGVTGTRLSTGGGCLARTGGVECWRDREGRRDPVPVAGLGASPTVELISDSDLSCARDATAHVRCWGSQEGFTYDDEGGPRDVAGIRVAPRELSWTGVRDLARSSNMGICGATDSGARCAELHRLGDDRHFPELAGAAAITGGFGMLCGALDASVRCVGSLTEPSRPARELAIRARALTSTWSAAGTRLCAVTMERRVACVRLTETAASEVELVNGLDGVEEIALADDVSLGAMACARRVGGEVWCWGDATALGRTVGGAIAEVATPRPIFGALAGR